MKNICSRPFFYNFQNVYTKRVYFLHFCELISRGVFHINKYINNYLLSLSEKELIILIVLIFLWSLHTDLLESYRSK